MWLGNSLKGWYIDRGQVIGMRQAIMTSPGEIEIKRLTRNGGTIQAAFKTARAQEISLFAPGEIKTIAVKKGQVATWNLNNPRGRRLSLPAGQEVLLELHFGGR